MAMTGHLDPSNTSTNKELPDPAGHAHIAHIDKFKPVVGLVVPLDGHVMRHDDPYVQIQVNTSEKHVPHLTISS